MLFCGKDLKISDFSGGWLQAFAFNDGGDVQNGARLDYIGSFGEGRFKIPKLLYRASDR